MPGPVVVGGGGGFCDVLCFEYEVFCDLSGTTINKAYSVVARVVEPELGDEVRGPGREAEHRLDGFRDSREVGLRVLLEAAGVSDSYNVRMRDVGRDLSARAEKERPRTGMTSINCNAERRTPVKFS